MNPTNERARATASAAGAPLLDRFLIHLGFDRAFVDGVLGDLAEEQAQRIQAQGATRAHAWHAREIVRSLPHWVAASFRRGDTQTRLRIAGALALAMSIATSAVIAFMNRDGSPAAIVFSGNDPIEGVVVNSMQPTQLQTHVVDDRGHRLSTEPVQFRRVSGEPIVISQSGIIHCDANADAIVRATARDVDVNLAVHCRPVRELRTSDWVDLLIGDAPRDLPFVAVGTDGRPVTQLRGTTDVSDTSVAALDGAKLQPRAAGVTDLTVSIGDRRRKMQVIVHTMVASFSNLRDDERHVAIPVRLARGDTTRLALPRGVYWLKYLPRHTDDAPPSISLDGGANCGAADGLREYRAVSEEVVTYCVIEGSRASVTLAHGMGGAAVVQGALALDRVDETARKP